MNFTYFFLLLYSRGNQQAFKGEWFALKYWVAPWVVRALGSVPEVGCGACFLTTFRCLLVSSTSSSCI